MTQSYTSPQQASLQIHSAVYYLWISVFVGKQRRLLSIKQSTFLFSEMWHCFDEETESNNSDLDVNYVLLQCISDVIKKHIFANVE